MDRAWAELCYLHWWISERRHVDHDTTFFSEKSFAWEKMNNEFRNLRLIVVARKEGLAAEDHDSSQTMDEIAEHRTKLGRLIACYLVFMNSTRSDLIEAAAQPGISLKPRSSDNPLRYSAIYIVALILSVCVGVYLSAISFDAIAGAPNGHSLFDQAVGMFRHGSGWPLAIMACRLWVFSRCAMLSGWETRCADVPYLLSMPGYFW